jgi:hypothetical protein
MEIKDSMTAKANLKSTRADSIKSSSTIPTLRGLISDTRNGPEEVAFPIIGSLQQRIRLDGNETEVCGFMMI